MSWSIANRVVCFFVTSITLFILFSPNQTYAVGGSISEGEVVFRQTKITDAYGNIIDEFTEGEQYFIDPSGRIFFYSEPGVLEGEYRFVEVLNAYSISPDRSAYERAIYKYQPDRVTVRGTAPSTLGQQSIYPMTMSLREYLESQSPDQVESFIIRLKNQPVLKIPKIHRYFELGLPSLLLEGITRRYEAIEQRKREMLLLQGDLATDIEYLGGQVSKHFWIINAVAAEMPIEAAMIIAERPGVEHIELNTSVDSMGWWPPESSIYPSGARIVTQSEYFRRRSYDGSTPTIHPDPDIDRIYVSVIDKTEYNCMFQLDHLAFNDDSTPTNPSERIFRTYDCIII